MAPGRRGLSDVVCLGDGTIANRRIVGIDGLPSVADRQSVTWAAVTTTPTTVPVARRPDVWTSTDGITWTKSALIGQAGVYPLKVGTVSLSTSVTIDGGVGVRIRRAVPESSSQWDRCQRRAGWNDGARSVREQAGTMATPTTFVATPVRPSPSIRLLDSDRAPSARQAACGASTPRSIPVSGTVYTDPRGRTWTLTTAAAIGRRDRT